MTEAVPRSFENQNFKSENFSQMKLDGSFFYECTFEHCEFSETFLRNTQFCTCKFLNCKLSLIHMEGCRFQEVLFMDCKIVGADFFKCDKRFFTLSFKNSLMQYCNFSDLNMKKTTFLGSRIENGYFMNTGLMEANFNDVDLNGTIFHNCDLSQADFSSAMRYDINPQTNNIKKAKFSFPEAAGLLKAFDIILI